MTNTITIFYGKHETGPAELLTGGLARIAAPMFSDPQLWRGDIVRLTHQPDLESGPPAIACVVHRQYPCKSLVQIHDICQGTRLTAFFALLGCDSYVIEDPCDEEPGLLAVAHPEHVDPVAVAAAAGIPQDCQCPDCSDPEEVVDYYLRVETSYGTLRLRGNITSDGELVFNWVVHEEDTTIFSTQLFEWRYPVGGGEIQERALSEKEELGEDNVMHFMTGGEIGCFVYSLDGIGDCPPRMWRGVSYRPA
jgi:hypothetical protein